MWARSFEIGLGLWLVASPAVFERDGVHRLGPGADVLAGMLVIALAAASFFESMRRAHVGILAVAAGLVAHGYFGFDHPAPLRAQSEILVGLTLVLFAIAPMEPTLPPRSWRRHLETHDRAHGSDAADPDAASYRSARWESGEGADG